VWITTSRNPESRKTLSNKKKVKLNTLASINLRTSQSGARARIATRTLHPYLAPAPAPPLQPGPQRDPRPLTCNSPKNRSVLWPLGVGWLGPWATLDGDMAGWLATFLPPPPPPPSGRSAGWPQCFILTCSVCLVVYREAREGLVSKFWFRVPAHVRCAAGKSGRAGPEGGSR
jgi:hypothetical protein